MLYVLKILYFTNRKQCPKLSVMDGKYIVLLVLLFFLVNLIQCQMPKKPPILALVDDIPFIECDVCQKAAKVLFKSVKLKREQISPMKVSYLILFY